MPTFPLRFIGEPIEVRYDKPPVFSKSPTCPNEFTWRDETFHIIEILETWQDFTRRGRFASNMRPEHLSSAARRGSWGVGRFSFRVRVDDGRIFEIYYDRAPASAGDRMGHWFLMGERIISPDGEP